MTLLEIDGVSKAYGGVRAARDVSFSVASGELVALIGPNGAGKSTVFNMVGGQLRPDAGRVRLNGEDVTGWAPRDLCRRGVGRTFQVAETFVSMTAMENVQVALMAHHEESRSVVGIAAAKHREAAVGLLEEVGLGALGHRAVSALSYGDIKRLELAIAMAGAPCLLLMDEPTAGMAPKERAALMQLVVRTAQAQRVGVLFTEHDMGAVFGHADRILVLVQGTIIAEGSPEAIRANQRVRDAYLGDPGSLSRIRTEAAERRST